jgi:hypothetical protein
VAAVALVALVVVRISGGDSGGSNSAPSSTTSPPSDATGERALAARPSALTAAQLGGIRFADVTAAAGLSQPQSDLPLTAEHAMSSAAAVADYDRDGRPDVYLSRLGRPNSLYRNLGDGTFADVTEAAGVAGPTPREGSGAAAFADVDADGCDDLYVAGANAGESVLYVNDCHGHFADQTAARGLTLPATSADLGAQGHGVTFADYDHDGDLDLLVLHWDPAFLGGHAGATATESIADPTSTCQKAAEIRRLGGDRVEVAGPNRSRLFGNDGAGHFSDVSEAVGLHLDQIAAFTGDFVDLDGDGWQDLVIAGDFCTSAVYRNDAGHRFVDITAQSGAGTAENAMGSAMRDMNADGRPDWFESSISLRTRSGRCITRLSNSGCSGNRLYVSAADGTYRDATDDFGVRDGGWGWGAAIEDFGNDGRLEIAQTNGYVQTGLAYDAFKNDATRFWVPTGDGDHHEDGAALAGLAGTAVGHALVPFDFDGDGDLDLLIANFGEPPTLYRNDSPSDRHWLTVQLDDPAHPGNRQGIGARVVVTADGSTTGWIDTAGSYESQKPPVFHVGLGGRGSTVRVEVWWPGATDPQVVDDVTPDQLLTVTRAPR